MQCVVQAGASPLHLPCGRAILVVFQDDALRGEFIPDAVGFRPVFRGAGGEAGDNQLVLRIVQFNHFARQIQT